MVSVHAVFFSVHSCLNRPCHLRVNITIVYEHIVCAMSAFSMCMLRVVFNVDLF